MNDTGKGGLSQGGRAWHRVLRMLVVLAVLPLPVAAYFLGVYVLPWVGVAGSTQHFLRDQAVLVLAGLVVSGVGGFVIWSTAISLTQAAEGESLQTGRGEPAGLLPPRPPLSSSVTRMPGAIEREADEINRFTGQLDSVHPALEPAPARLEDASFIDAATGLYNERYFVGRLEQEIARYHRFGHPLSLVLIELGGAGAAGERRAAVGDEALRAIVEALLKQTRGVDLIFRHGDDELAVLLVQTPRAEAGAYAPRIRAIVSTCLWGHGERVTASFGTASLPDDATSGHDLVRAAAEALDAAKRAGRNCVVVYGESDAEPAGAREGGSA